MALGACAPKADEAFRARIPESCKTTASCEALEQEAKQRFVACEQNPPYQLVRAANDKPCAHELEDRVEVSRRVAALHRSDENAANAAIRQRADDYSATSKEAQRLHDVSMALTGGCEDGPKAQAAIAAAPANVPKDKRDEHAGYLRQDVASKRAERIKRAEAKIEFASKRKPKVEELQTPKDALASLDEPRAVLESLRCTGQGNEDLAPAQASFDAWSASLTKAVADEDACRASTECTANRLAEPICKTIENRKGFVQTMARERANPSGYVNKVLLHDMGEAIQNADADLVDLKKDFKAATKKDFSEARCQKK